MKKSILIKCLLLVLLAWLLTSCSLAAANQVQSTSYKAIPTETWEQLKQNQQSLVLKLNELSVQLEALQKPSEKLTQELTMAEQLLTQSQQELTILKTSLENVKGLQERTQTSLTKLTKQINEEREKQKAIQDRLRVQRTFAYILLGIAIAR